MIRRQLAFARLLVFLVLLFATVSFPILVGCFGLVFFMLVLMFVFMFVLLLSRSVLLLFPVTKPNKNKTERTRPPLTRYVQNYLLRQFVYL